MSERPVPGRAAAEAALFGGGAMGAAMRALDWSQTPLGPVQDWPQSLKTVVRLMLDSRYAMWLGWGPQLIFFCNDAYRPTLGMKRDFLGAPASQVWAEIWPDVSPRIEHVLHTGEATWDEGLLLFLERSGFKEETYHSFSYSPAYGDSGAVEGMWCVVTEDTERVVGARRLAALGALATATSPATTVDQACALAVRSLAEDANDVPFLLAYLLDDDGKRASLSAHAGLAPGSAAAPTVIDLDGNDTAPWPLVQVRAAREPLRIDDLGARVGAVVAGLWPEPIELAMVLPLARAGSDERVAGFLVAGVSPRLALDEGYQRFLRLAAGQVANAMSDARAFEEEKRRAEALTELDRAKTMFFSNVSHELRTPLTLMLGPIADLLAGPAGADAEVAEQLALAQRNGQRLKRLVNSLLDFSRIEAGRMQTSYEPVDLAAFTAELASVFRSAVEKAGLEFVVDCPPLPEPVFVDRGLWEKIVLNLLSNALKHTFEGCITVALRADGNAALLSVTDTGTGIPDALLPRLFERFFRVEGARARTIEGSGIGLAMVHDLARLHGGGVGAQSREGEGSRFHVRIPFGRSHLPDADIVEARPGAAPVTGGEWLDEAGEWLHDTGFGAFAAPADSAPTTAGNGAGPRPVVLIADDNADMRAYLGRLLARNHDVVACADGEAALRLVHERAPDLVLTDVMMPRLDGFALLRALRADRAVAATPVIMLSARAGDEARIEGLRAGADDYLTKPFNARELLARIDGTLALARARRETEVVLESLSEGFVAVDAQWRYTYINAAAEQMLRAKREALLGVSLWDAFPDALGSPFEAPYRRAMEQRVPLRVDAPFDALGVWPEVSVYPVANGGLAFYFRDVKQSKLLELERARAQQALRDNEAQLRELADAMPQIVYVTDGEGKVEFVNRQWREYTGREWAQTMDLQPVVHPDDLASLVARWEKAQHAGAPLVAEFRLRSASDGAYRWFLTRSIPQRDEAGRIMRWYGTSTDIDRQKRDGEALRRAHEALQQADRRKDEFLATLAHELRNPLAPLRNAVEILQSPQSAASAAKVHQMMRRQIDHMVRLVDDLMEVSRITSGKIELQRAPVALSAVLESAIETSRPLIESAGHRLEVDVDAEPALVLDADAMRLAQVFSNLLNNAAKYTEAGGRIMLRARRDGERVVVSVRDTGIGIAPEMLPRVFDLFTQADRPGSRQQGGMGIGLSLVRSLLALHGGSVEAHSEGLGRGSEFVVRLPLGGTVVPAAGEPPRQRGAAALPGAARVLVVDDSHDAADSLGALLDLLGADVEVAYDGPSALAVFDTYQPAVTLLDIGMPGMDGLEVARRVRARGNRTMLVALTGWGQAHDRERSREAGFDHHLVKPVDVGALKALLATVQGSTHAA
jgi:PAS domain S-box-containing protein